MLKVPKKGSTEWVRISDLFARVADEIEKVGEDASQERRMAELYAPVEIGVMHMGRGDAMSFGFELSKLRMDENKRKFDLRKGYTREQAPELWEEQISTPQGVEQIYALARKVVRHYINGVKGVEGYEDYQAPQGEELEASKRDELVDLFDQLGVLMDVKSLVLNVQGLKPEEGLSSGS